MEPARPHGSRALGRALLRVARRRVRRLAGGAASWGRAIRAVLLAVGATVGGLRMVTRLASERDGLAPVLLIGGYAVFALAAWALVGTDRGSRVEALTRAGIRVLVVHAVLLVAGIAAWAVVRFNVL